MSSALSWHVTWAALTGSRCYQSSAMWTRLFSTTKVVLTLAPACKASDCCLSCKQLKQRTASICKTAYMHCIVIRCVMRRTVAFMHRNPEPQASLASRESTPDESLIAEGWIVAGTIMSNRDCKPGNASTLPQMPLSCNHHCACDTSLRPCHILRKI